ncbi:Cdc6B protein [Capsaspora owczarzaki ATCC 30864]|nr:Cdc6B protein [Capsaspora owczarzaki ATCC 30864]|eukprot:XP_004345448.2 Cdc6B protein [Capsaspora owczarzaki ATCC 30864]
MAMTASTRPGRRAPEQRTINARAAKRTNDDVARMQSQDNGEDDQDSENDDEDTEQDTREDGRNSENDAMDQSSYQSRSYVNPREAPSARTRSKTTVTETKTAALSARFKAKTQGLSDTTRITSKRRAESQSPERDNGNGRSTQSRKRPAIVSTPRDRIEMNKGSVSETEEEPDDRKEVVLTPKQQALSRFGVARLALELDAVPEHVPCRDTEHTAILRFWHTALQAAASGAAATRSLYISGAPGTGKTASVTELAKSIPPWESENRLPHSKTIYINCMSLKDPSELYGCIMTQLAKLHGSGTQYRKSTAAECLAALERRRDSTTLILDEMDQLETRTQEILYKLFEWPTLPGSRVILIGIANALDLVDRTLQRLKAQNCPPEVLNFPPYSEPQISGIIADRLSGLAARNSGAVIDPVAIKLCAARIAASSGDVRKALDICRKAIAAVETEVRVGTLAFETAKVDITRIASTFGSRELERLQRIPIQQKLLLCAMLASFREKPAELGKVFDSYCQTCRNRGIAPATWSEFCDICMALENCNMIVLAKAKEMRKRMTSLNVTHEDVAFALKDTPIVRTLLSEIERSDRSLSENQGEIEL